MDARPRRPLLVLAAGAAIVAAGVLALLRDVGTDARDRAAEAGPTADTHVVGAGPSLLPIRDALPDVVDVEGEGDFAATSSRERALGRAAIHGRVYDLETDVPIGGALFHADGAVRTDAEGWFRYPIEETESFPFVVEADGYCYLAGELDPTELVSGALRSSRDDRLGFPLVRGAPYEGTVTDVDGRPVAQAWVTSVPLDERKGDDRWLPDDAPDGWRMVPESEGFEATTNADGCYEIIGLLPRSAGYGLRFGKIGFESRVVPVSTGAPGRTATIDVVLERSYREGRGELAGHLYLNGEPTKGTLYYGDDDGLIVRDGGFYRIGDVREGPVVLEAVPLGWADGPGQLVVPGARVEVVIVAGQRTTHDFQIVAPLRPITGIVRCEDGTPYSGRMVNVAATVGDVDEWAETDEQGRFAVELPDIGIPYLLIPGVSIGDSEREVFPGDSVDVVLPNMVDVALRVVDAATGEDIPSCEVDVRETGGDWQIDPPLPRWSEGRYAWRMFVGTFDLVFTAPGYETKRVGAARFTEDAPAELLVEMWEY